MKSKLVGSGLSLMLAALLGIGGEGCQKRVPEPESRSVAPATSETAAATSATPGAAAAIASAAPATAGPSGLIKDDVKVGTGPEARKGDHVFVHYTGTLTNGTKFDSSRDRNQPFDFTLGQGSVILGWDQGLLGMKVGGRRKLTIPSAMGYGPHGSPPIIPPNATLLFDVELLAIK